MSFVFDELRFIKLILKTSYVSARNREELEKVGFTYEGLTLRAAISDGYSYDRACFAVLDIEWPSLKKGFEGWLQPENFDVQGKPKAPLNLKHLRAKPSL